MNLTFAILKEEGQENFIVDFTMRFVKSEEVVKAEMKESMIELFKDIFELEYLVSGKMVEKDDTVKIQVNTNDTRKVHEFKKHLEEMSKRDKEQQAKEKAKAEAEKLKKNKPALSRFPELSKFNWN